tara:strand:+ start:425 stop:685 length:261 start_codon:yes stop_codon:yes gene_type:complete
MKQNNDDTARRGLSVEVRNNDINFALRKFKKKVAESGILQELRQREFYEKPSTKRAKAKKAGIARWKKKIEKAEELTPSSPKNRKY